MEPTFVHLRLHTEFSLSDGLIAIPNLMEQAAEDGMVALGITDKGNLYATVKFYQAALQAGIKPIIGADLTILEADNKTTSRLTLLCQNNTGYLNLVRIISKSFLEGQATGSPLVARRWLEEAHEGLIALSGGLEGNIGQAILNQDNDSAGKHLAAWATLFKDRFYLEISRVGKAQENAYLHTVLKLAKEQHIPVVATNDVRFLKAEDYEAHEARVCIQDGVILNDPNRERRYTEQQYLRSQAEMQERFKDMPSALKNSVEIAKRCNVTFTLGKSSLPHFPVPSEYTTETYLCAVAKRGLDERLAAHFDIQAADFAAKRAEYDARLALELDVINKMGFAGYFLIVADFTQWAKDNGIPVGPGRGSGPGSLVAYSLKITDLDPIALELLFERFLNPERVSMPDFDIDFCMDGRDRVIEYVMEKHGHDSVSQIITYGTMAAKAVVRDVGRVLGLSYGFVDKIAKLIPFELGMTLDKALEVEPLLKERYEQEEEVRTLIDLALKLEGITRNVGKHAGGIVIAPGKLTDFVPVYCEASESSNPVTQFDKDDVELVGLVKFDFLGLKTLTIIDRALRIIKDTAQKEINIGLLPLHDSETFKLLKQCQSTAVFQLESHGMRDLIKRLQPDCFEDLIALVALFRPGPLQSGMVDDFINRKHGRAQVIYPHPKLEPILRPTYGVILYQEQVMQIAQVLAGYTLGAADILRRAMGKKKPEEMAKQRAIFCDGAIENGVNGELANQIFDLMEKFAGYGFNKSHSASYALIAYQTAWLKAHYPAAFMAAVLSSDLDRTDKVIILLDECRAFKLEVAAPSINQSNYYFTVVDTHHLLYGLGAIKGAGQAAIEAIVAERNQNGAFKDLFDFCARIDLRKVNKRVLDALIKSGAMDCLNKNRASLLATLPKALLNAEQQSQNLSFGQSDLLAGFSTESSLNYVLAEPWDDKTQLQGEKDTLGFYLTGHPMNRFLAELKQVTTAPLGEIHPGDHPTARAAGMITDVRTRQTKRGDRMAIFTLEDGTSAMEVVCFSETYNKYRPLLVADNIIVVEGDVNMDEFSNRPRILGRDIMTLEEMRERTAKGLQIDIDSSFNVNGLKQLLLPHTGGNCLIRFRYMRDQIETTITLARNWAIKPTENLLGVLRNQPGIAGIQLLY